MPQSEIFKKVMVIIGHLGTFGGQMRSPKIHIAYRNTASLEKIRH